MLGWLINREKRMYWRLGFFSDQKGIIRRYRYEHTYWEEHLLRTKSFIISEAQNKQKGKVAVLGSGWLLDVPLKELSELFSEVYLFDIYHPMSVRRLAASLGNVKMVTTDISGFASAVFNLASAGFVSNEQAENIVPEFKYSLQGFDFVVSCNILNQLDIILLDYLQKHVSLHSETFTVLRRKIQQAHINILPVGKSCIISDVKEVWIEKNSNIKTDGKRLVFASIPEQNIKEEWVWKFDNHGTYNIDKLTWFKVWGIVL